MPELVFIMRDEINDRWHLIHFDGENLFIDGMRCVKSTPLRKAVITLLLDWADHYEGVEQKWDVT